MNDPYAPRYLVMMRRLNIFKNADPPRPRMPWPMWGLVNVLSLGALVAAASALPRVDATVILIMAGFFILGPALVAGALDGRGRTWGALLASGWVFLLAGINALTFTEGWQNDCGLGQGFTMLFAMIGAAVYPVAMALAFAVGRGADRLIGRATSSFS